MVLKGIVKYIVKQGLGQGREHLKFDLKVNRKRAQKCRTGKEPLVEAMKRRFVDNFFFLFHLPSLSSFPCTLHGH